MSKTYACAIERIKLLMTSEGWSDRTALEIVCRFIDAAADLAEPKNFSKFLRRVVDETNHLSYPIDDWKYEVSNGDTMLGYDEWARHKRDADQQYYD